MQRHVHRHRRTATVPHFIALLGVLHEAATRGLALLADAPAPRGLPRLAVPGRGRGGTLTHRSFQALGKPASPVSLPWKAAAAGGRG